MLLFSRTLNSFTFCTHFAHFETCILHGKSCTATSIQPFKQVPHLLKKKQITRRGKTETIRGKRSKNVRTNWESSKATKKLLCQQKLTPLLEIFLFSFLGITNVDLKFKSYKISISHRLGRIMNQVLALLQFSRLR